MDYEKQTQLAEKFPELYVYLEYGFDCGNGWFDIIWQLSEKLLPLVREENEKCIPDVLMYVTTVKEKYGGLRVYMSLYSEEMDKLIDEASDLSYITCEICGKPGKLYERSWLEVRCEECHDMGR